jgi:hypothetical protein
MEFGEIEYWHHFGIRRHAAQQFASIVDVTWSGVASSNWNFDGLPSWLMLIRSFEFAGDRDDHSYLARQLSAF